MTTNPFKVGEMVKVPQNAFLHKEWEFYSPSRPEYGVVISFDEKKSLYKLFINNSMWYVDECNLCKLEDR